jgi:hypothetical protein
MQVCELRMREHKKNRLFVRLGPADRSIVTRRDIVLRQCVLVPLHL